MTHQAEAITELKRLGGWLCLDFMNTAERAGGEVVTDFLKSSGDVLLWGEQAGILTANEAREQASNEAALNEARAMREMLYRIFSAFAGKRPPDQRDLEEFNRWLREAMGHLQIQLAEGMIQNNWYQAPSLYRVVLWTVIRSAFELMSAPQLGLLRECAAADCGWLFLDTSRNHSRRWCDMEDCGNRAKARRHYQRIKRSEG